MATATGGQWQNGSGCINFSMFGILFYFPIFPFRVRPVKIGFRMRLRGPHVKIVIFADLFFHAARPTACENTFCPFAKMIFVVVYVTYITYIKINWSI